MEDQVSALEVAQAARQLDLRQRVGCTRSLRSAALSDWDLGGHQKRVFELLLSLLDWQTGLSQPMTHAALGRITGINPLRLRLAMFKLAEHDYIVLVDAVSSEGRAISAAFPGLVCKATEPGDQEAA
jgi:hypothetical protein